MHSPLPKQKLRLCLKFIVQFELRLADKALFSAGSTKFNPLWPVLIKNFLREQLAITVH